MLPDQHDQPGHHSKANQEARTELGADDVGEVGTEQECNAD
ncbi:hypothetical protein ABC977_02980 [Thioalkalicoccus limnaeus]|uniref:Uncharacterized protein n=1 Tax=Thioalkalicoccus limnaeus TaxID=120681 RepID=A0ABV4BDD3_9GAMM